MEKVYRTTRLLAFLMIVVTIMSLVLFMVCDVFEIMVCDVFEIYGSITRYAYALVDVCFFGCLLNFFLALKRNKTKGSPMTVLINMGLTGSIVCLISTVVFFIIIVNSNYGTLFNTPRDILAQSLDLLPYKEPDDYLHHVTFIWLSAWITIIASFIMMCKYFGKKNIQKASVIFLVIIMLLDTFLAPDENMYLLTTFTLFLFSFSSLQNPKQAPTMSVWKAILTVVFFFIGLLLVAFVVPSYLPATLPLLFFLIAFLVLRNAKNRCKGNPFEEALTSTCEKADYTQM